MIEVLARTVSLKAGDDVLIGDLNLPRSPYGLILFAHGSGSSRKSRRNQFIAFELNRAGYGTLLIDLLTEREELVDDFTRHLRFDVQFLAKRLTATIHWLKNDVATRSLRLGLFGASSGSAAAIVSAAENADQVEAVVSRGGRPDLAGSYLSLLKAPTLLIVGEADQSVLTLNKEAMLRMRCQHKLEIVPGATHLFEEVGALDRVAIHSLKWFTQHIPPPVAPGGEPVPVR